MYYKHRRLPSEFLSIEDEYTAYCLDEAIAYISCELADGKKINLKKNKTKNGNDYSAFSQLYSKYK